MVALCPGNTNSRFWIFDFEFVNLGTCKKIKYPEKSSGRSPLLFSSGIFFSRRSPIVDMGYAVSLKTSYGGRKCAPVLRGRTSSVALILTTWQSSQIHNTETEVWGAWRAPQTSVSV